MERWAIYVLTVLFVGCPATVFAQRESITITDKPGPSAPQGVQRIAPPPEPEKVSDGDFNKLYVGYQTLVARLSDILSVKGLSSEVMTQQLMLLGEGRNITQVDAAADIASAILESDPNRFRAGRRQYIEIAKKYRERARAVYGDSNRDLKIKYQHKDLFCRYLQTKSEIDAAIKLRDLDIRVTPVSDAYCVVPPE